MNSFRNINQDVRRRYRQDVPKKRKLSCWVLGLVLIGAAALSGFSVWGTLFGSPAAGNFLGELLVDSYGAIAFVIPAYFVFAAFILLDGVFRPGRIFVLNCIIFPFITLSIGFSYLRDFDFFAAEMPVLRFFGKNGFGFLMIFLTVMECIAIAAFTTWLFPPVVGRKMPRRVAQPAGDAGDDSRESGAAGNNEVRVIRVPIQSAAAFPAAAAAAFPAAAAAAPCVGGAAFPEMRSEPLTPMGKAALDEAYEKAQTELEKLNIRTLDATLEGLNDKLKFIDEIDRRAPEQTPPILPPAVMPLPLVEALPPDEDADEPLFDETVFEDEVLDGDLEKLITRAETEAAQKTEEFMRKQPAAGFVAAAPRMAGVSGAGTASTGASSEGVSREGTSSEGAAYEAAKKKTTGYIVPVEGLLRDYEDDQYWLIDDSTKKAAAVLKETLNEFNIQAEVTGIRKGPVITMFEILPSPGVKLSKIVNLQDNIALRLAASPVRIVAPIPGKHAVGIEIPNKKRSIVSFKDIISTQMAKGDAERKKWALPVVLGKDITGGEVTVDLAAMPHLLIAGATGSGKSVCVNTMILSILYQCKPWQCRLILIDPKIVELKLYNDIPHLLTPVITEPKRAFQALQYCICEMERRYACLDNLGVRDIKTYNKRVKERNIAAEHMPYIVVVIDEFADLMATTGKELESTVARLAAMSRAVGIHIVLATQRPSIDVITGLIKSNIPSRIAFMVASMMDSRIIIDTTGAEKLLGKGDMLYSGITDPFPVRMQGAFVSEEEVERVVEHVKTLGEPDYIDEEIFVDEDDGDDAGLYADGGDDPLYDKAVELVVQQGKASASYIQRRLKVGYNRAARLVEEMEHNGVVGPAQGSRPRDLLRAV
jgi:S-DNA-T family DNA segregation ATPase FtsK/SpoIIIE